MQLSTRTYKKNRVIDTLIKTKIDNADLILCAFSYEEEVTVACSFFPIFLERKKAGGYIMAFWVIFGSAENYLLFDTNEIIKFGKIEEEKQKTEEVNANQEGLSATGNYTFICTNIYCYIFRAGHKNIQR